MEDMTEDELEVFISSKNGTAEARYVLGKLLIEGTSPKVSKNETKGLNWLKDALKKGDINALEYKTYWDIRFDKAPKLEEIVENLEKVVQINKSARACNTLAELNHAAVSGATAQMTPELAAAALEK